SSNLILARSPLYMAKSRGDSPSVMRALGSAPRPSNSFSVSVLSVSDATAVITGVLAYCAALVALTSAPNSIQRAMNGAGCQVAATFNTLGIGLGTFDIK